MATVLALFLLVGALSACGQASGGGKQTAADNTPAELVFYSTSADSEDSFNQRFGDPLRKKFPNFTIKYIQKATGTTLPELMAAGTQFDIYFDSIGNYMDGLNYNFQFDMTDLIREHKVDLNRFEPSVIDAIKQISGGKIYGLPVFTNNMITYYNKDIFDRFGVPYPKDGMTWDEMLEIARRLDRTDSGKNFYGLAVSQSHILRLNPFSAPFVDPKTNKAVLETDKWKMLVDKFTTIHQIPGNVCRGSAEATDFKAGKIAMAGINGGLVTELEEMAKQGPIVNWDLATYPQFPEAPGLRRRMDVSLLMLSSSSKHPDDVFRVMQAVSAREEHLKRTRLGRMSTLKDPELKKDFAVDLTVTKGRNMQAIFKTNASAVPPFTKYNGPANSALEQAVKDVLNGADINSALRKANERANQEIDAMIEGGL